MPINLTKAEAEMLGSKDPLSVQLGRIKNANDGNTKAIMEALKAATDMIAKIDTIQRESAKEAVLELKDEMKEAMTAFVMMLTRMQQTQQAQSNMMVRALQNISESVGNVSVGEEIKGLSIVMAQLLAQVSAPKEPKQYEFRINRDGQGRMLSVTASTTDDANSNRDNQYIQIKQK